MGRSAAGRTPQPRSNSSQGNRFRRACVEFGRAPFDLAQPGFFDFLFSRPIEAVDQQLRVAMRFRKADDAGVG
jgi:hypothetical protein